MATATNRKSSSPNPPRKPEEVAPPDSVVSDHWILRGFDAVYRFLASLKLAVLCILTLATVLAGATIFESWHTMAASRQYIYQHPLFAILLAFLGTNIFCAATIRYPWKKRQTGFVVTHIGLLVVLAGAFVSLQYSDEGQLGMAEGTSSEELVRIDHTVVRVQKIDPETGKVLKPYVLPIEPGVFSWNSEELAKLAKDPAYKTQVIIATAGFWLSGLALAGFALFWAIRKPSWVGPVSGSLLTSLFIGSVFGFGIYASMTPAGPRREVLTDPSDPFVFVAKDYLASSMETQRIAEPDADGLPYAKIALMVTPPGADKAMDAFGGQGWVGGADPSIGRVSLDGGPATIVYQTARGHRSADMMDDFMHPPKNPLKDRVARIHYPSSSPKGEDRVYEWILGADQLDKSVTLPGSDITVTLTTLKDTILGREAMAKKVRMATGEDQIHLASFKVKQGASPERVMNVVASLPVPSMPDDLEQSPETVRISYFHPPEISEGGGPMSGKMAQIELLSDEKDKFYIRAFNRDGLAVAPNPITVGKPFTIATKSKMGAPLTVTLSEFLPKARVREVFIPVELPFIHRDKAIPALQAEMTVDGVTKKVSLLRSNSIEKDALNWQFVQFPSGTYQVGFDFDRQPFRPNTFGLKLKRFEPGKDPDSGSAATYTSEVELTDRKLGIIDDPRVITMNEPLSHQGWTFYQSSFGRAKDPETGVKDGVYSSLFQVHYDPAWKIIYSGCLLVVLGTFLQFYMRAGLFTDGGRLERERAEAKKAAAEAKQNGTAVPKQIKPRPARDADRVEDL